MTEKDDILDDEIVRYYGWLRDIPDRNDYSINTEKVFDFRRKIKVRQPEKSGRLKLPATVSLRKNCSPVEDQRNIGSCHDEKTEVLTDSGWILFKNLNGHEKLASVDPVTRNLIFESPSRIVAIPYNGKLFFSTRKHLSFAVTPDHKMLVRTWNEGKRTLETSFSFVEMKDVGWYSGLMAGAQYEGEIKSDTVVLKGVPHKHKTQRNDLTIQMSDWLRFLGIYSAEGTMLKSYAGTRINKNGTTSTTVKGAYKIQIAGGTNRKKTFIRDVLKKIGTSFCELPDRFTFSNKRIFSAMKELGLFSVKAPQKFVPEFIFRLPFHQIQNFLDGHFAGDGHEYDGIKSHYTSSAKLADDLQRLIILSGGWGGMSIRPPRVGRMKDGRVVTGKHPEHRVSRWKTRQLSLLRKKDIEERDYNGIVYCAEVPTHHTLVTRRNKTVLISGNCTAHAGVGLIEYFEKKAYNKYLDASRLFLYKVTRNLMGVTGDTGAFLRDTMKAMVLFGVPPERAYRYVVADFDKEPPAYAYALAQSFQALSYYRLDTPGITPIALLDLIKSTLSSGLPLMAGFSVYSSILQSHRNGGRVPFPAKTDRLDGGHAVMFIGFSDTMEIVNAVDNSKTVGALEFKNSWGASIGDSGFFYLPYKYILEYMANDWWSLVNSEWIDLSIFGDK